MSNIFLKNELANIFTDMTENSISLPQFVSIIDKANKTDNNLTSSAPVQFGGTLSATSVGSQSHDVNKLISMLTSDSSSASKLVSETSTVSLEEQLRQILNQDGGSKKNKKQKGGNDTNVESVKRFFAKLKSQGVNVDVKLNDQTMSEFFGLAQDTTTVMPDNSNTVNLKKLIGTEEPKTEEPKQPQTGGKKKGSKKGTKEETMEGGVNPGFQAFLDLKKHIANKLGISNGPKAAKVAGAVQKDVKSDKANENLDAVKIAQKGKELFDKNMEHYKSMIPK